MRVPVTGAQFRRDVKRAQKRGRDMSKLREVITLLIDHPLSREWKHFRDCHIEPDRLLLYKIDGEYLHLSRTGTHSDLF